MEQPPAGLTTKAIVTKVIDGDTIEVEIRRKLRVRLIDCWAPETRTKNLEEKTRGLASKEFLFEKLTRNRGPYKNVILFIPADTEGDIKDIFTMGRVLGRVWVDNQDISDIMVKAGYATQKKKT